MVKVRGVGAKSRGVGSVNVMNTKEEEKTVTRQGEPHIYQTRNPFLKLKQWQVEMKLQL